MKYLLLLLVGLLFSQQACTQNLQAPKLLLIAHRGGVVDEQRSENSLAALEEAIRQGYTHVEVDARITADGHVVCFHNDELEEEAGIAGKISELPLDSVVQIVLTRSQETIPTFEAYVARCAGRIGLMIDVKGCKKDQVDSYVEEIEAALIKHDLLASSLFLINKRPIRNQTAIVEHFKGKAKISWRKSLAQTQKAAATDPTFAQTYYVFNHGADFTQTSVAGFQALGLPVIVSINEGHYQTGDPQRKGETHVRQMLEYGVDGLQIDSWYATALPSK